MGLLVRGHRVVLIVGAPEYWERTLGQPPARERGFEVISQLNAEEVEVRVKGNIARVPIGVVTLVGGRPKKPLE